MSLTLTDNVSFNGIAIKLGINTLFRHSTGPKLSVDLPSQKKFLLNNKTSKNILYLRWLKGKRKDMIVQLALMTGLSSLLNYLNHIGVNSDAYLDTKKH